MFRLNNSAELEQNTTEDKRNRFRLFSPHFVRVQMHVPTVVHLSAFPVKLLVSERFSLADLPLRRSPALFLNRVSPHASVVSKAVAVVKSVQMPLRQLRNQLAQHLFKTLLL